MQASLEYMMLANILFWHNIVSIAPKENFFGKGVKVNQWRSYKGVAA